jgi:LPXTG-motif cell wall-anchored protein
VGILVKKVLSLAVAALVGLFALVGLAPAAQAYPEGLCDLEVSAQVVNSGESITATCTYSVVETDARKSALSDTTWVMTFNGETRNGTGETFTQTFEAPVVSEPTTFKLTSVGTGDAGTCSRSVNITVLPNGSAVTPPGDGDLPNTGGPNLWILLAGFGLVGTGIAVTLRSRGRVQTA